MLDMLLMLERHDGLYVPARWAGVQVGLETSRKLLMSDSFAGSISLKVLAVQAVGCMGPPPIQHQVIMPSYVPVIL